MNIFRGAKSALTYGAVALAIIGTSCSGSDFRIDGDIEGADNELVILEKADFGGRWIVLDSVRTSGKGNFSFKHEAPVSPEIYRLRIGNSFVYVPMDSTETVTLKADAKDIAGSWSLSGSEKAENLSRFEKDYRAFLPHADNPDSTRVFKRRVYGSYLQNTKGSVVAYYVLTKTIDENKPLFDPNDKGDLNIFAAVATAFKEFRPDDPRTPLLENTVITARRAANSASGRKLVLEAEETGILPIVLPDENGQMVSLASIVGKGKPTVLMFGVMTTARTVEANHMLADLIRSRNGDLEVYSVSFDADAGQWREAARNVPWTTVLDHNSTSSAATDYNVPAVPCFYIIDRAGNLVDRTGVIEEVAEMVRKHS